MLSEDWDLTSLSNEVKLLTGFPFKSQGYTQDQEGIRLLRGDNVAQGVLRWDGVKRCPKDEAAQYRDYLLQRDDVVLAMDRPWIEAGLKYAALSEHDLPALLVQRVACMRGRESLDTRYLRYLIASPAFTQHILAVQTGTAVPHVSASQILEFRFRRPPLPEQRAIAEFLGAIDDKIELNRRMNKTLDATVRALAEYLLKMESDKSLVVADVADVNAKTLQASELPSEISYVAISDVVGGEIRSTTRYARGSEPSRARRQPRHGDVVLSTVRPERRAYFLALHPPTEMVVSTGFATITARDVPWSFLYASLTRAEVFEHLGNVATGGAYPAIRPSAIEELRIVVPRDLDVLREYHAMVEPMLELMGINRGQVNALAELRDLLLPRLVSGRMTVG